MRVTANIPDQLVKRIDTAASELRVERPSESVTRTTAILYLLERGLDAGPPQPGDGKAPRPRPMAKARKR